MIFFSHLFNSINKTKFPNKGHCPKCSHLSLSSKVIFSLTGGRTHNVTKQIDGQTSTKLVS